MLKFDEEVMVRVWLHGETHAACTIRTMKSPQQDVVSCHISWFPNHCFHDGFDGNKHVIPDRSGRLNNFQNVTARPAKNYAEDRRLETSWKTQHRYECSRVFEEAQQRALKVQSDASAMSDPAQRAALVLSEIANNSEALLDLKARDPDSENSGTVLLEYLEENLVAVLHNVKFQDLPGFSPKSFPAIKPDHEFGRRENQVIRNGQVLTSAAKYNLPGLGAAPIILHVKGTNVNGNKPVTPEEQQEYDAFVQKYCSGNQPLIVWGLNLRGMANFWNNFVSNDRQGYQYASRKHNCCGVVTEALLAGGMGAYISVKKNLIYRDTPELLVRVQRLRAALDELNIETNVFVTEMKNSGLYDAVTLHPMPGSRLELWPFTIFQQHSRSPHRLGMRREQVAIIDSHLKSYHALGWSDDHFNAKLEHLVVMMRNVLEHRRLKPQSDRRQGVDSLGIQIVKFLNDGIYRWAYTNPLHTYCAQAGQSVASRYSRARQVRPRR